MGLLLRFAGYIATHIVQQLLQKGYRVRGTVRDPTNEKKTKVLRDIAEKVSWAHLSSVVLPPPNAQRPTPNARLFGPFLAFTCSCACMNAGGSKRPSGAGQG